MAETEAVELTCCGRRVTEDGYCQYRGGHPRQVTPELVDKAVMAAARVGQDLYAQARAVLDVAFAEEKQGVEW